jgi:hypothetical protein
MQYGERTHDMNTFTKLILPSPHFAYISEVFVAVVASDVLKTNEAPVRLRILFKFFFLFSENVYT